MKLVIALLFVAAASAYPGLNDVQLKNAMDELVIRTLEYVRWLLRRHEPYSFPPLPEQHLMDEDMDIKFTTSEVQLSKAGEFTIDKMENDVPNLHTMFQVTIPAAHLEGKYQISGMAFKKKVMGSGKFMVDIDRFVQAGEVQYKIMDHSLQVAYMNLNYKLAGAKFDIEGLNIEGMTQEQIQNFMSKNFLEYLKNNEEMVAMKTAAYATDFMNKLLKGKSLMDVIEWMKKLVASTPDPPPFPF